MPISAPIVSNLGTAIKYNGAIANGILPDTGVWKPAWLIDNIGVVDSNGRISTQTLPGLGTYAGGTNRFLVAAIEDLAFNTFNNIKPQLNAPLKAALGGKFTPLLSEVLEQTVSNPNVKLSEILSIFRTNYAIIATVSSPVPAAVLGGLILLRLEY